MSFRLYESAWVQVEGIDQPLQAHKDPQNLAAFNVGEHRYDIDARPLPGHGDVPKILSILSLEAVRKAGLRSDYGPVFNDPPESKRR